MAAPQLRSLTFAEFLASEGAAEGTPIRHELVGGQAFAMTGGTNRHAMCIAATVAALYGSAVGDACRITQGDGMVKVGESAYYPDVMVTCGLEVHPRYEVAPCLLVEVTSPGTAHIDRREKLAAYQGIVTVRTYLVVDPDAGVVEVHERADDTWTSRTARAGDVIPLQCPRTDLAVDDLFRGLPA